MHGSNRCHRLAALTLLTVFPLLSVSHSWNEQLSVVGSNGSFTGAAGYPRGYMARTDPGFNGFSMLWQLPSNEAGRTLINSSDLLCHPAQRTQNQTSNYPRLQVAPGSAIAMKYLENGHVSLPSNQIGKPSKAGSIFVFGTTQPKTDETLENVLLWSTDGSGGDKQGRLLASNNFDDDRCYQINSGPISTSRQKQFPDPNPGQPGSYNEQWCETNVILPTDPSIVPPGKTLTIYWIWQWPTLPGRDPGLPSGKDEYYTTCSDLDVRTDETSGPMANKLTQQDPQPNAVPDYKSRSALVSNPKGALFLGASSPSASAATSSAAPANANAAAVTAPPAFSSVTAFTTAAGTTAVMQAANAPPSVSVVTILYTMTLPAAGATDVPMAPGVPLRRHARDVGVDRSDDGDVRR